MLSNVLIYKYSQEFNMSYTKTKTMAIGKQHEELQLRLGTGVLEQVTRFVYLGGLITEDGRCEEDVKRRIGLACAAFG